jgi:hypothetical protein
MTVSKAGTEALAAVVAVNKCIYTDRDWLEDVREKSADREEFNELVIAARKVELAENAAMGRVYVVMGEPSKILNAHEASALGMEYSCGERKKRRARRYSLTAWPHRRRADGRRPEEDRGNMATVWGAKHRIQKAVGTTLRIW